MKAGIVCVALGLTVLGVGCSTISTNYDYDTATDFSRLRTYDWMKVPPSSQTSPFVLDRIKTATDRVLHAKGYQQTSNNPDFLLAAHAGQQSKIQVTDWGYGYGYAPRARRYRGGRYRGGGLDVYEYHEGTLILDVVDARSKNLIWRGTATGTIDPGATPEKKTQKIDDAVQEVLRDFPPPR